MKIGELASATECPVETIRFYEREGLLSPARRNPDNNYRHYDQNHLDNLFFIRRCRSLDMTLDEIRTLLNARVQIQDDCEQINQLIQMHLLHVQTRINELKALELELDQLRTQCLNATNMENCGILRELDKHEICPEAHGTTHSHVGGSHQH